MIPRIILDPGLLPSRTVHSETLQSHLEEICNFQGTRQFLNKQLLHLSGFNFIVFQMIQPLPASRHLDLLLSQYRDRKLNVIIIFMTSGILANAALK